jgi:hypothetical protein
VDWELLLGATIGLLFAGWLLSEYWGLVLIVVGIALVVKFTLYAAILVFVVALSCSTGLLGKGQRFTPTLEAVGTAFWVTALVVGASLLLGGLSGGGPTGGSCSRIAPQFC